MTNQSSSPEAPGTRQKSPEPSLANANDSDKLQVIGVSRFCLEGDVHKLVTFLNQTLKDKGFVFGIAKDSEGLTLNIYQTDLTDR